MVEQIPNGSELDRAQSTLLQPLLFSEQKLQPPIPIGVRKIKDKIPPYLQKRPTQVLPVEVAVNKLKPQKVPKLTRRVILDDEEEREYEGLFFERRRKGHWFVIPPQEKIPLLSEPFHMNGARQALLNRQDKARPIPPTQEKIDMYLKDHPEEVTHLGVYEVAHDAQEIFTMAAWQYIRKMLIEDEIPSEKETDSLCYREVYLNDYGVIYDRKATEEDGRVAKTCGQVDIYGTLGDNQGVIIEFGSFSEEKELQVLRQYYGTKSLIEENNHNQSPPITTLIGSYYKDTDGVNIIHLKRPERYTPQLLLQEDPHV